MLDSSDFENVCTLHSVLSATVSSTIVISDQFRIVHIFKSFLG